MINTADKRGNKLIQSFTEPSYKHLFSKPVVHVLLIVVLGLLVYSNTFYVPFQYDDINDIRDNPIIKSFSYFKEPSRLEDMDRFRPGDYSHSGDYSHFSTRFITLLTFAMNYRLNGLDVTGYHLVNFGIHIINALLVYLLATFTFKITFGVGTGGPDPASGVFQKPGFFALFTALLFVCHPIQTEAVTYIVQRLASLATLFYLLSIVLYIKWRLCVIEYPDRKAKAWVFYVTTLTVTSCAMLTKENTFTLPVTIALYEFIFFQGGLKKRVLFLMPLLLTMLIIPLTLTADNQDVEKASRFFSNMSRQDYLFTQFSVIVTYLRLLFLPINQNLDYDYPVYRSFFEPEVLLSFVFLMAVFTLGVYLFMRSRNNPGLKPISFGIFWFFITLSVESSIIPIADVLVEHRVYLPSVGFFIALTSTIWVVGVKWGNRAAYANKVVVYAMVTVTLALSGAAYVRNSVWKDSVRLLENTVEGSPNKARPHIGLGNVYTDKGRIDEAIKEYQTALRLKPDLVYAHYNLGNVYYHQGRIDAAINEYKIALTLNPDYADVYYNLGNIYRTQGRIDEAIKEYQTALRLKPDLVYAHYNLGNAYYHQGRIDAAINEYQIVLKLKPDHVDVHNNLGNAYSDRGRIDAAINEYKIALTLNPGDVKGHYNLGLVYINQGKSSEAINEFKIALQLKPDFAQAHLMLKYLLKK